MELRFTCILDDMLAILLEEEEDDDEKREILLALGVSSDSVNSCRLYVKVLGGGREHVE